MNNKGLKRLMLIVALVIASASFSRGLILTFFYDIFDACVNSTSLEPSLVCEYGPQVLLNTIAGLVLMGLGFVFLYKMTGLVHRVVPAIMGLAYVVIATGSWRFLVSLSDNFQLVQGPQTLSEYMFVFYANQEPFLIGLLFALIYNWLSKLSSASIPEKGRRAPRWKPRVRKQKTV